jgi:hypothetical protein
MTKAEFITSIATKTGLSKTAAAEAVDAFIGTVVEVPFEILQRSMNFAKFGYQFLSGKITACCMSCYKLSCNFY